MSYGSWNAFVWCRLRKQPLQHIPIAPVWSEGIRDFAEIQRIIESCRFKIADERHKRCQATGFWEPANNADPGGVGKSRQLCNETVVEPEEAEEQQVKPGWIFRDATGSCAPLHSGVAMTTGEKAEAVGSAQARKPETDLLGLWAKARRCL